MDNSAVAERLDAFAALLDLAGSSYYTARAYRRAAELIRGLHTSVADLVRSGHVRELRGIGPGIEARLRELVETGRLEELDELENEVRPELVGFGRLLGLSPKRSVEIGDALGIRTAAEFREAIEAGQLFLPSRFPDPTDVLVGVAGATAGLLAGRWLRGPHARERSGGSTRLENS